MSGNITLSSLGGGIPGAQPQLLGGGANGTSGSGMVGGAARGRSRLILREAFGRKNWLEQVLGHSVQPAIGNFRYAMNAGDILGTVNEAPLAGLPHPNQVNGPNTAPGRLHALNGGGVQTGGAAYSGNPKYVYDSSDYVRFKKLQAKLRTYNDLSFGGSNNGSYTFLMNVRS